jgi:hypothetical protein
VADRDGDADIGGELRELGLPEADPVAVTSWKGTGTSTFSGCSADDVGDVAEA